jgi:hypothetical protein
MGFIFKCVADSAVFPKFMEKIKPIFNNHTQCNLKSFNLV